MLFNSLAFIFFFPLVVAIYFAIPYRYRWGFLLAASYYYYASWKVEYLLLIFASTLVDYWAGLQMGKQPDRAQRRPYLFASLLVNIGLLFFFKYFNFTNDTLRSAFTWFDLNYVIPNSDLLLPIAISFYTFQTLSYTIEVYYGSQKPERHFGIFALYVSFFPQLVAGPIERSQRLLPQFHRQYGFDYQRVTAGLKRMAWGFFKKLVIADRLGVYTMEVFNNPDAYSGWPVFIAMIFFAIQVYCDLAAYSDIAIGAAKVMGYELMENFRRPFFAENLGKFWENWHISVSSWFRDYVFFPIAEKYPSVSGRIISLFVTFIIIGLWHGPNWTYVAFGALHSFWLIVSFTTISPRLAFWGRLQKLIFGSGLKLAVKESIWQAISAGRGLIGRLTMLCFLVLTFVFLGVNSIWDYFTLIKQALMFSADWHFPAGFHNVEMGIIIAVLTLLFDHSHHHLNTKLDLKNPFFFTLIIHFAQDKIEIDFGCQNTCFLYHFAMYFFGKKR